MPPRPSDLASAAAHSRVSRSSIAGPRALNFIRIASMVAIEPGQQTGRNIHFHQTVPLFSDES
jgi:hypothetical protein